MPDFADVALEYEKIKDTPEVIDDKRVVDNAQKGKVAADDQRKRQQYLPDKQTHAKLQEKYETMFDKSKRAGARSTLHGLVLPSGRKNFSDFHDNFTGVGRYKARKTPDKVQLPEKGPKVDVKKPSVVLYERCVDCLERVNKDNCIPSMIFLPPGNMMSPIARSKWDSVQIKPEAVLCYLFCDKCPTEAAKKVKEIRHDPFKSAILIPDPMNPGKQMSVADKESQDYIHQRALRIEDNVFKQIQYHRNMPNSDVFYSDAVL